MEKVGLETARYLELGGERIYTLGFGAETPEAWALLCGPFPSDRLYSLAAWVKWARFLAGHGVTAVRFDYSGTGESTGDFARMDFDRWLGDVERMCDHVSAEAGGRPVFLHGLGMGALLAQKVFAGGRGHGLLMWSPPSSAVDILKQGLMIRLSMDMLLYRAAQRKSANDYIQDLKAGRLVQIDGYSWSGTLWASGERLALDKPFAGPGEGEEEGTGRPWRHVLLDDRMSPLVKSQSMLRAMNPRAAVVPSAPLDRDFDGFFEPQAAWVRASTRKQTAAKRHA
jgi:hypothetical protein